MKRIFPMLLCICLLLAACSGKEESIQEPETLPDLPESVWQVEPTLDTTDYAAALSSVFTVAETAQTEFAYDIAEGSATLTAYTGEGAVVRVPALLGGFPVTKIAEGVFQNREQLKVLILPATVTDFGTDFLKNTALTALCTPLLDDANKSFLKSITYLKLLADPSAEGSFVLPAHHLENCTALVALELPEGSELGDFALVNCKKLMYLNADALTKVGEKALEGCSSLQSLKFGTGLIQIGFAALRDCKSLMDLEIPFVGISAAKQTGEPSERTDYLGYLFGAEKPAFAKGFYPAFLKKITLLEGCAELPDFAFYECTSLQTLSLPATLTRIGGRALSGCTALTELILPDACTSIGDAACSGCTALSRVQMPAGISVGQNAFWGCPLEK